MTTYESSLIVLLFYLYLVQSSAKRAMAESEKMFEEMIRSIERMRSEVTKLIGINEKAAFNQADGLVERLEQEIDELKKKEIGLKQLYSTDDHIHFLQVRNPAENPQRLNTFNLCSSKKELFGNTFNASPGNMTQHHYSS